MAKKFYLIIGVVLGLVLIAAAILFFINKSTTNTPTKQASSQATNLPSSSTSTPSISSQATNLPSSSTSAPSASTQESNPPSSGETAAPGKITLPTSEGTVIINDPYKESLKTVSKNADLKNTPDYEFVYLGDSKSFVITLKGKDLSDSRSKAEQAFLDALGISQADACKLEVVLAVDPGANPNAAGKNYGLSFCPNGIPIPTN